ncbi:MAG: T9SS type A sorting domain-containing protein [Bacteroidetes bacterium]|nr:T9SS type A sorting domain-containing protein [Bacteroidota bacterium]
MVQKIGIRYQLFNAGIASIMKFSQDGSRFLHVTLDSNMVELFDFNRCTGLLSNYSMFKIDSNFVYADGASFSPNKKYIYVSTGFDMIRQYDIEANDITGSQIIIGTDDGIPDPFYAKYYLHQLGPDEKIYVTSYDQSYSLHVINSPNTAGLGCDFVQRGFHLLDGTSWFSGAPNIPNYSLGSSSGSDCDTLTSVLFMQPTVFSYSIYPNPCYYSSQLSISGATEKAEIFFYNTLGQVLYKTTAFPSNNFIHTQLPVRDLVAGIYLVKVSMGEKEIAQKLVKR